MGRKEPFRNNARLVLAVTAAATLAFVAFEVLLRKSQDFSPDFLASVYAAMRRRVFVRNPPNQHDA